MDRKEFLLERCAVAGEVRRCEHRRTSRASTGSAFVKAVWSALPELESFLKAQCHVFPLFQVGPRISLFVLERKFVCMDFHFHVAEAFLQESEEAEAPVAKSAERSESMKRRMLQRSDSNESLSKKDKKDPASFVLVCKRR